MEGSKRAQIVQVTTFIRQVYLQQTLIQWGQRKVLAMLEEFRSQMVVWPGIQASQGLTAVANTRGTRHRYPLSILGVSLTTFSLPILVLEGISIIKVRLIAALLTFVYERYQRSI